MSEALSAAIEVLSEKVAAKARELEALKRTVNLICVEAGQEPIYEVGADAADAVNVAIRHDQFYGKSPIVAAREYLESRGRAVPSEEILSALDRGGFDFEANGWKVKEGRLRNLAISLSKNTAIFHRLPNGTYGLRKFYPDLIDRPKPPVPLRTTEVGPDSVGDDQPAEETGE